MEPYERLPKEGSKAFRSFCVYRDMGPDRTLAKTEKKLKLRPGALSERSTEHRWTERIHAYESFLDSKKREAEVEAIKEMQKKHIKIALSLQEVAARALEKLIEIENLGNPEPVLKPSEIRDLADLGMRVERLNRGEPESVQEQRHEIDTATKRDVLRGMASSGRLRTAVKLALDEFVNKK